MAGTAPGLSSASYQRALEQAREIRRRKTRESAQAAERLWFAYIKEMLTGEQPVDAPRERAT